MKVLKLTESEIQSLFTWIQKGATPKLPKWLPENEDGTFDLGHLSKLTDGTYIINISKIDKTEIKNTQVWINKKEEILARIFEYEDIPHLIPGVS